MKTLTKMTLLALTGITLNCFAENPLQQCQTKGSNTIIATADYSFQNTILEIRDTIIDIYNGNNRTSRLHQIWSTSSNAWVNDWKDTFTYDANNNLTTVLTQDWNTSSNTWVNNSKSTYTYDADNKQTAYLNQTWNTSRNAFVNVYKYIYTYDANKTTLLYQTWNTSTNAFVNVNIATHYYPTTIGSHNKTK